MASLSKDSSLPDYSEFIQRIYGMPNDRFYTLWDMLDNVQRFSMRCVKGIRKNNVEKTKHNAMIAFSWYTSLTNRLHINVDNAVWNRFPYLCSYCGEAPCVCQAEKVKARRKVVGKKSLKPRSVHDVQIMFARIYPPGTRTSEHAAIHLAEETGELSEAVHLYMSDRSKKYFKEVSIEAADYLSCIMGVLNSIGIDAGDELSRMFYNNCHDCHKLPCECTFRHVCNYRS